ncbi:hypothetical protein BB559_004875, partial [Furculomyces boomerangus]
MMLTTGLISKGSRTCSKIYSISTPKSPLNFLNDYIKGARNFSESESKSKKIPVSLSKKATKVAMTPKADSDLTKIKTLKPNYNLNIQLPQWAVASFYAMDRPLLEMDNFREKPEKTFKNNERIDNHLSFWSLNSDSLPKEAVIPEIIRLGPFAEAVLGSYTPKKEKDSTNNLRGMSKEDVKELVSDYLDAVEYSMNSNTFNSIRGSRHLVRMLNPTSRYEKYLREQQLGERVSGNDVSYELTSISFRMDTVMQYADKYVFDNLYYNLAYMTSTKPLDSSNPIRIVSSLFIFIMTYIVFFYLGTSGSIYLFAYDKDNLKHPKFLKNQVQLEIKTSLKAFPLITVMTIPWIYMEINNKTLLYDDPLKYGIPYLFLSAVMFILFTDFCIYWVHRLLHHRLVYTRFHKLHHKWIICTPFASHAFDPIDGYLQSVPYHIATMVFPIYKWLYLGLFAFVNVWSVMIHDGNYVSDNPVVNGAAHHTIHHILFNYNYGQFTTIFDRLFNSYR